jgi:hypothetical protein
VRALTATSLCGLAVMWAGTCAAANTTPAPTSADTQFANYAFASELGSGVYAIDGRTITIYTVPASYSLREAQRRGGRPGIRLLFPFTFGFFDFEPVDLVHLDVPTSIGAVSLEPGVELDWWLNDAWHVYPYIKAGGTYASSSAANAVIWGAGVRSDYRFDAFNGKSLWRAELAYAGVHYPESDLPNDSFTRLRNGLEWRRNLPSWEYRGRAMQLGPYLFTDIYFNAPEGPASGISARTLQYEVGLMFDIVPGWEIFGMALPRLGIGYREAGILSGWRLVLGDPF